MANSRTIRAGVRRAGRLPDVRSCLSRNACLRRAGPNRVGNAERQETGRDGAIEESEKASPTRPVTGLGAVGGTVPHGDHCHRGVRPTLFVTHRG